jgi:hypothetical protein
LHQKQKICEGDTNSVSRHGAFLGFCAGFDEESPQVGEIGSLEIENEYISAAKIAK